MHIPRTRKLSPGSSWLLPMMTKLATAVSLLGCCLVRPLPSRTWQDTPALPAIGEQARNLQDYSIDLAWEGHPFWTAPGDRFDLVCVRRTPGGPRSELLMEGILVSAVGRQSGFASKVTVRVTPAQAQALTAARRQGKVVPVLSAP
jgi:hypothetical protein